MHKTTRAAAFVAAFMTLSSTVFAQRPPGIGPDGRAASAATDATQRAELTAAIVNKWKDFVEEAYEADGDQWAGEMARLASYSSIEVLQRAARAVEFQQMNDTLLQADANRTASSSLDGANVFNRIGDVAQDLVLVPVTPCRIIDTRLAGGAIAANTTRAFDVTAVSNYSFQGGDATNCGVGAAGSFAAAVINFTVVTPSSGGYITAFPYLGTQPLAATLNYNQNDVRGNLAIVKLDQGASANELNVYTLAQTHLVADIVGYFSNPVLDTFQCVDTADTTVAVAAGATANAVAPACAAGYSQTSTNCESSVWQMPFVFIAGGTCSAQNNSGGSANLRASRTCCRVAAP
jgi:hypothetical protein